MYRRPSSGAVPEGMYCSKRLLNGSQGNSCTASALLAHAYSKGDGCQIVFVFLYSEKCRANSRTGPEYGVSKSKEKEKTEIRRVYSLPRDLMAIPKMNVAVGTGWRVSWQSVETWGRKTGLASIFLCEERGSGNGPKCTMPEIVANIKDLYTRHGP
jgi:hypothetical protein